MIRDVSHQSSITTAGFTLIELMTTLAIFTVMTAVVLANYPDFNTRINRDALVQNIALAVREAQVYGTSIQSVGGVVAGAIGIHFFDPRQNPRSFILFVDDGDSVYDPTQDTIRTTYAIPAGNNTILYICGNYYYPASDGTTATRTDGTTDCSAHGNANTSTSLDVVFHRPNPEALLSGTLKAGTLPCDMSNNGVLPDTNTGYCAYANTAIFVGDGKAPPKRIIIWNTGQIATQ